MTTLEGGKDFYTMGLIVFPCTAYMYYKCIGLQVADIAEHWCSVCEDGSVL